MTPSVAYSLNFDQKLTIVKVDRLTHQVIALIVLQA